MLSSSTVQMQTLPRMREERSTMLEEEEVPRETLMMKRLMLNITKGIKPIEQHKLRMIQDLINIKQISIESKIMLNVPLINHHKRNMIRKVMNSSRSKIECSQK